MAKHKDRTYTDFLVFVAFEIPNLFRFHKGRHKK